MNRGSGRVAAVGDQAGQLGDLCAVAGLPVGVDGGDPCVGPVVDVQDCLTDRFGDRDPDREAGIQIVLTQPTNVG
jgi:hypothetical protein